MSIFRYWHVPYSPLCAVTPNKRRFLKRKFSDGLINWTLLSKYALIEDKFGDGYLAKQGFLILLFKIIKVVRWFNAFNPA